MPVQAASTPQQSETRALLRTTSLNSLPLETMMTIKHMIAAAALLAAAASSYAGQSEFVAPDAGFVPSLTRAEVRQQMAQAYARRQMVMQQYTGQDPVYARGVRTRQEVRMEAREAARQRHAGDVNDIYFG
jgi:hypothetical protein